MSGSESFGEVESTNSSSNSSKDCNNDNTDSVGDGIGSLAVGAAAHGIEVRTPMRSTEARTLPSSSSSLQRSSTPIVLTANERIVESWIQQSLTMPSATAAGETLEGVAASLADAIIDAGMPATRHRREGSLGSGYFAEGGFSAGQGGASSWAAGSPTGAATSSNNDSASHALYNVEFQASWSNHSTSNGDDSLGGSASSPAVLSPGLVASEQRPLAVSQVSSTSPSREEDFSGISSVIHDAARITNWQTVVDLCECQPESAAYIGRDGWTALHHACNRRCPYPNVVDALIKAYPDALLVEEEKGWLPLHYACRFKAPTEVVRLLLNVYPEKGRLGVSRPDRKGRSPLYYAVRYDAPTGVVGLLLDVDASAVLEEDQNADSPLALVWDAWAEKWDGKRTLQKILWGFEDTNSLQSNPSDSRMTENPPTPAPVIDPDPMENAEKVRKRLEGQTKVFERWNKVNIFLKAVFGFPLDEDWEMVDSIHEEKKKDSPGRLPPSSNGRKWRILHALSAIKCHHSLFLLAAALHPEQAFEVDQDDLKRIDNVYHSKGFEDPSNMTALHFAASSHASGDAGKIVLTQLLALNPGASQTTDSQGSTPLHRIAENKYKSNWIVDGVEELYNSYPGALRLVDENGRLPLHRAASAVTYYSNLEDDAIMARSTLVRLLQENEDASHHQDKFGCLPLHLVAKYGRRWDVQVQALYDANTAAVRARTGVKYSNRLALHFAAANPNSDCSLVSKLVELNPRGSSQADRKGMLPLHLACDSGHAWKILESIHQANPQAVQQAEDNGRGWMALHMAASAVNADDEVISKLVEFHPTAATAADSNGHFPLHLACMSGKSWENGLSTLFDANPDVIRFSDKEGLLPLHIVSMKYCVKSRAESQPTVLDLQSLRSSRATSLEADQSTAKEIEAAKQVGDIFNLLKADPTVLSS